MKEKKRNEREKNQFSFLVRANHVNSKLRQHWSKKEGKIMNTNTSFCVQIEEKKRRVRREEKCASSFVDQTGCYF